MKKRNLGEIDRIFYMIGKVALAVALAAVLLYFCTGFSVLRIYNPCLFYKLTGYYCPGCGGTRSMRALIDGDILFALYAYPPIPYAIVTYTIFMCRCFYHKHLASRVKYATEKNTDKGSVLTKDTEKNTDKGSVLTTDTEKNTDKGSVLTTDTEKNTDKGPVFTVDTEKNTAKETAPAHTETNAAEDTAPAADGIVLPYIYVGVALVIAQWIAKLLAQAIWHYDWFRSL